MSTSTFYAIGKYFGSKIMKIPSMDRNCLCSILTMEHVAHSKFFIKSVIHKISTFRWTMSCKTNFTVSGFAITLIRDSLKH